MFPTSLKLPAATEDTPSIPTGVQLTPMNPVFRHNPYPVLGQLRNAERIHRDEPLSRWFVTGFEEVREILRNKDLSSNIHNANPDSYTGRLRVNAQSGGMHETYNSILFKDDPEHRRLRSLVSKPFSPKAVENLRPRIRANVAELLDTLTAPFFDLVESFAGPLPVIVISELLGVESHERATFKQWSEDIAARRRHPGTDLISSMITADEVEPPLSDAEIRGQTNLLLIEGNLTTSDLIANGMKAVRGWHVSRHRKPSLACCDDSRSCR